MGGNILDTNICHGQVAEIIDNREKFMKGVYLYQCKVCFSAFYAPKPELLKSGVGVG